MSRPRFTHYKEAPRFSAGSIRPSPLANRGCPILLARSLKLRVTFRDFNPTLDSIA